jgi:hypothetical protein
MSNMFYKSSPKDVKKFAEFDKQEKEKIAFIVETRSKETILSPIVENYVYATTRALDYGDRLGTINKQALWEHAINRNLDYFDVTALDEIHPLTKEPRYLTFRKANMFLDHKSKDIENSVGFIFDAYKVEDKYDDMHITTLFGIDKTKTPHVARDIISHPTRVATSMGCTVTGILCTACLQPVTKGHICDHLKYMKGGKVNGYKVAEFILGPEFFEDSIVRTPACHTAYVIDSVAELIPGHKLKIASVTSEIESVGVIILGLKEAIKTASSHTEKVRLLNNMDLYINKLQAMVHI